MIEELLPCIVWPVALLIGATLCYYIIIVPIVKAQDHPNAGNIILGVIGLVILAVIVLAIVGSCNDAPN